MRPSLGSPLTFAAFALVLIAEGLLAALPTLHLATTGAFASGIVLGLYLALIIMVLSRSHLSRWLDWQRS